MRFHGSTIVAIHAPRLLGRDAFGQLAGNRCSPAATGAGHPNTHHENEATASPASVVSQAGDRQLPRRSVEPPTRSPGEP